MGYLDNRTVTVDAILTKKGRQLLSQGRQFFNITKFALADDEVDYHLWNPAHPSGSNYYGVAIEQMPVLEPSPDETQVMRYKLVSLDKSTVKIPIVGVGSTAITFSVGGYQDIAPFTQYSGGGSTINLNASFGYTAILANSDIATLSVIEAAPSNPQAGTLATAMGQLAQLQQTLASILAGDPGNATAINGLRQQIAQLQARINAGELSAGVIGSGTGMFLGDSDSARSIFAVGMKFRLTAKQLTTTSDSSTTLTIVGNETGGSVTISVTNNLVQLVSGN